MTRAPSSSAVASTSRGDAWQFGAPAWLGDDTTVRELVPMIRAWPGTGGHHHAVRGLDVLAAIGSDLALPDDAVVAIAHPLRLGEALQDWVQVLADYEIVRPFPQLGRDVHALTDEEKGAGRLARFDGVTVPFGNVLRLERRGWYRGPVDSDGGISCLVRPVGADPAPEHFSHDASDEAPHTFAELDAVTASEVLADLTAVTTT